MSYYYEDAVARAVSLLMNKQYPESEMVLEDDVIVLTYVDIRCSNDPGETDDSDEHSDDELLQVYRNESTLDLLYEADDDDDDFIDDRPESELSEHSDTSENESEEEEDREYNSESEDGNESESENQIKDENESENEPESSSNGNRKENESDSDSDDEPIQSPRKKPKLNVIKDDSSCDESGSDNDRRGFRSRKVPSPVSRNYSSSRSSDSENESDDEDNSTNPNAMNDSIPKFNGKSMQQKHSNKFSVFLLPKIDRKLTCLRYHGRIGMGGIEGNCRQMSRKKFCDLINIKRNKYGFTRLNLMYANARHMECRKAESELEKPVRKLLIHLIDQWFPLGIPQELHLNRAINLLECMKKKISEGKVPRLKHSEKFYALIPHQGDNRRRERFKTIEHCNNKIKYVNRMQSAIECLSEAERMRRKNPLDYFIEEWLKIELNVLKTNDEAYQILYKVVENTQHVNSARRFYVEKIFRVHNTVHRDEDGDFSTNIPHNRRFLFHFSFACNLPCILREGLLPSPPHIHSNNRFLGDGIYFWDTVANAGLNYKSLNTVYILVCRVALGNTQEVKQMYLNRNETLCWEDDIDAIFCKGEKFSSSTDAEEDLRGAKIYCGQLGERKPEDHGYSLYNEYVVRNKQQVLIEYIMKLKKAE